MSAVRNRPVLFEDVSDEEDFTVRMPPSSSPRTLKLSTRTSPSRLTPSRASPTRLRSPTRASPTRLNPQSPRRSLTRSSDLHRPLTFDDDFVTPKFDRLSRSPSKMQRSPSRKSPLRFSGPSDVVRKLDFDRDLEDELFKEPFPVRKPQKFVKSKKSCQSFKVKKMFEDSD